MEYLLNWRKTLARHMLGDRRHGVEEIARRVGYGSARAFSVAFSRHAGLPPGRYASAA
ncbi:helix-turn-helix domain-containing protein [Pelagovum pacificum]|uniref:helix-turn-helix domain-containing protein n=1 Tax=Pelagovum pacificum TaxID=2588711 RepID=UPI0018CC9F2E|nr:helix-turn-helix domain-containing protein [Pelagovum pacificum]QQA42379.1 helix-turn-helix domain-containing protein [Pelagovum pacificum]